MSESPPPPDSAGAMESDSDGEKTFFDLPAELRNDIYTLALVKDRPYDDQTGNIIYKNTKTKEPALLRVSKQVRHEALPVFYGANTFRLDSPMVVDLFLLRLTPGKLGALRAVRFTSGLIECIHDHHEDCHARFFTQMKSSLRNTLDRFGQTSLRPEAMLVPFRLDGNCRWQWVTHQETEKYEVVRDESSKRIVRK